MSTFASLSVLVLVTSCICLQRYGTVVVTKLQSRIVNVQAHSMKHRWSGRRRNDGIPANKN